MDYMAKTDNPEAAIYARFRKEYGEHHFSRSPQRHNHKTNPTHARTAPVNAADRLDGWDDSEMRKMKDSLYVLYYITEILTVGDSKLSEQRKVMIRQFAGFKGRG